MQKALAVAAFVLLTALAFYPVADSGFEVYHFDSQIQGNAFQEVFRVHKVHPGPRIPVAEVNITVSGAAYPVTWVDEDGFVSVGDDIMFAWEAFDRRDVLLAKWQGRTVMECGFGGGAGQPVPPTAVPAFALRCIGSGEQRH